MGKFAATRYTALSNLASCCHCKNTLSEKRPEFEMVQPHRGNVCTGIASAGHQIDTHGTILTAVGLVISTDNSCSRLRSSAETAGMVAPFSADWMKARKTLAAQRRQPYAPSLTVLHRVSAPGPPSFAQQSAPRTLLKCRRLLCYIRSIPPLRIATTEWIRQDIWESRPPFAAIAGHYHDRGCPTDRAFRWVGSKDPNLISTRRLSFLLRRMNLESGTPQDLWLVPTFGTPRRMGQPATERAG
jgi:hypothetical protein